LDVQITPFGLGSLYDFRRRRNPVNMYKIALYAKKFVKYQGEDILHPE